MVNRNSIYVLNKKDPDAIVYPTAEGKHIRITCDDFPSEEEFLAFKKWSDENFHEEEKLDHRESNHTLAADELSEAALAVPATDVILEQRHSREEKRRTASEMVVKLKDKLTETQFRRLWISAHRQWQDGSKRLVRANGTAVSLPMDTNWKAETLSLRRMKWK